MKRVVFLLAFVLCAILGLTLHSVSAAPPRPEVATYVLKQPALLTAVGHAQTDTAHVTVHAVRLARPVAVPDELAPAADSCREFTHRWHYTPADSIRVRHWRNLLQRPTELRAGRGPLHLDPGRQRGVTHRLHDTYISADSLHMDPGRSLRVG